MVETLGAWLEGVRWLEDTPVADFINNTFWAWPAIENFHFLGLALLVGMIGLLDLRMLGLATSIPPAALHRFVSVGVAGFVLCLITGALFFTAKPDLYIHNPAFYLKMLFVVLAGVNVGVFYLVAFRDVERLGPGDSAPPAAKAIGAISLILWIGVICFGRLLPFV